jgi:dihydroorotase-like cyclic amidohydrolase
VSNLHIKGGRLIDPKNRVDAKQDVFISDGKIAALGKEPGGFRAERTIDAANLVVCPGLVDLSARLREPGFEYKATLESEMQAAVAGGVTSLACPPDTDPPLDEPGLVEMLKHRAKSLNLVHVYPLGALTWKLGGERLTEMAVLHDAGCVAFSHADTPLADTQVQWRALQYASTSAAVLAAGRVPGARRRRHDGRWRRVGRRESRFAENHARDHPASGARDAHSCPPLPSLDCGRGGDGARRKRGGPAGELRRERASRAPFGNRPRLLRFPLPRDPAVSQSA